MKTKKNILLLAILILIAAVLQPLQIQAASDSGIPSAYSGKKVYDVTKCGADKKGKKDSTKAFEKAITKAVNKGSDAIVFIPEGSYLLKSQITLNGNVTIVANQKATIKSMASVMGFWMIGSNITIEGGTWTGTKKFDQNLFKAQRSVNNINMKNMKICDAGIGACFSPATATLSKVTVSNCVNRGVLLMNGAKVTLKSCTVKENGKGYYSANKSGDCGHGIGVQNSKAIIQKGYIGGNTQCGISLVAGTLEMRDATVKKNGRNGIGTYKKCKITINGGAIKNNGYDMKETTQGYQGISATAGTSVTVTDCSVSSNRCTGIYLADKGTTVKCKNVSLVKNEVAQIALGNGTDLTLENCTLKHSSVGVSKSGKVKITLKKTNKENGKKIKKL